MSFLGLFLLIFLTFLCMPANFFFLHARHCEFYIIGWWRYLCSLIFSGFVLGCSYLKFSSFEAWSFIRQVHTAWSDFSTLIWWEHKLFLTSPCAPKIALLVLFHVFVFFPWVLVVSSYTCGGINTQLNTIVNGTIYSSLEFSSVCSCHLQHSIFEF